MSAESSPYRLNRWCPPLVTAAFPTGTMVALTLKDPDGTGSRLEQASVGGGRMGMIAEVLFGLAEAAVMVCIVAPAYRTLADSPAGPSVGTRAKTPVPPPVDPCTIVTTIESDGSVGWCKRLLERLRSEPSQLPNRP